MEVPERSPKILAMLQIPLCHKTSSGRLLFLHHRWVLLNWNTGPTGYKSSALTIQPWLQVLFSCVIKHKYERSRHPNQICTYLYCMWFYVTINEKKIVCISNEQLICSCAEVSYDSSDDSCDEVHFGSLDSEEEVISTCAPSQCLFCDSFYQTGEQVSFFWTFASFFLTKTIWECKSRKLAYQMI